MSAIQGKHLVTSRARICYALVACWTLVALITASRSVEVADGQTFYDVSFSADGELSSNAELVRRFLSPLTVASSAAAPAGQAVNIADERFVVYVPAHQYPVDPQRVYIAGLSAGARVALRLAVAYPDVFRRAILNAGSDPIGNAAFPLPPADLFRQFQSSSHLVYVKGDLDMQRDNNDRESMYSLRQWCVFGVDTVSEPGIGHAMATPAALAHALALLTDARPLNPARLTVCRSSIDNELQTRLRSVESLLTAGQILKAQQQLREVDAHLGGRAAPRSVELAFNDHTGRSP
jgi:pimeloyl-ACP methyl ester carboxylesterase